MSIYFINSRSDHNYSPLFDEEEKKEEDWVEIGIHASRSPTPQEHLTAKQLSDQLKAGEGFDDSLKFISSLTIVQHQLTTTKQFIDSCVQNNDFKHAFHLALAPKCCYAESQALLHLVESFINCNKLDEAFQTAKKISRTWEKSNALRKISAAHTLANRFDDALEISYTILDSCERSLAFQEIFRSLKNQGKINEVFRFAMSSDSPAIRLQIFWNLIEVHLENFGDLEMSIHDNTVSNEQLQNFYHAIQIANKIPDKNCKKECLQNISERLEFGGKKWQAFWLNVFTKWRLYPCIGFFFKSSGYLPQKQQ